MPKDKTNPPIAQSHTKSGEVKITHHGAVTGVTGSCHQYQTHKTNLLIDCGLFQGAESDRPLQEFDFNVADVTALIVTHCHIDHVGRIPWLIAAGFRGPIYCTEPTAALLPLVLEDALGIHIPDNANLVQKALSRILSQLQAIPYDQWHALPDSTVELRFQPAGHIMGSAYVELEASGHRTVFSGDLGAPGAVFVDTPEAPERADILVLESTYGNRDHEARAERKTQLGNSLKRALADGGTVLIPAFSLGRTQEILAFIEELLFEQGLIHPDGTGAALPIILDSPLALRLTQAYRHLLEHWREPLQGIRNAGRFPLAFDQLITIEGHRDHLAMVKRLTSTNQPAVVLAASGMCQGGRIMNYLEAMLPLPETDVFFVGYQARGTLGAAIQTAKPGNTVRINNRRIPMNAQVQRLSGFSAHADRTGLTNFCTQIPQPPTEIRLVHGDAKVKQQFQTHLANKLPNTKVWVPGEGASY